MNHPWLQIKSTLITINNAERQRPMATNDGRSHGALLKFKGSGAISPSTPFSGGRSHLYLAGTGPGHWYNDLSLPTSRPRSQGCNSSGRKNEPNLASVYWLPWVNLYKILSKCICFQTVAERLVKSSKIYYENYLLKRTWQI